MPLVFQRVLILLTLALGLGVFLAWLPAEMREALLTGLSAQRSLVSLLFFFVLISLSLLWSGGQHVDASAFVFLNRQIYHSPGLDKVMWALTQLGSMWFALLITPVFFVFGYSHLAVEVVLGTMTLWLFVEMVKMLTDRSRPFLVLEGTHIIGRKESGRSFPSGHTSQIFFMATLLRYQLQSDFGQALALYIVALLVGFTRIYVGAHYPRDVLGGAVLGSVWGVMMMLIDPYLWGVDA